MLENYFQSNNLEASEDVFLINNENQSVSLQTLQEENISNKIFVFHTAFYKEKINRFFESRLKTTKEEFLTNYKPLVNLATMNFGSISDDETRLKLKDTLQTTTEELASIELSVALGEVMKSNFEEQFRALYALSKNLNNSFDHVNSKVKELDKDFQKQEVDNLKVLKVFEASKERVVL